MSHARRFTGRLSNELKITSRASVPDLKLPVLLSFQEVSTQPDKKNIVCNQVSED